MTETVSIKDYRCGISVLFCEKIRMSLRAGYQLVSVGCAVKDGYVIPNVFSR